MCKKFSTTKVFIVIPAYNEDHTIGDLVCELHALYDYPVVVVNDNSIDCTSIEARKAGAYVLDMPVHLGAWCCMQAGMSFSVDHGADLIVTMDADGQHHPCDVDVLVQSILSSSADMVIGSCVRRGSAARKLAWTYFRKLGKIKYADVTSGFRVYNLKATKIVIDKNFALLDHQDMGVIMALDAKGLQIIEQDVEMQCRICGKSRVFSSWPKTLGYMIATTLFVVSKRHY
ncbi:glycosyltransferase family 2 protein [Oceanidesulfovibrio indonesiensis]|nr:glycosyltransferase family 2 protein [Oceanidesulfovibrio indonesiensis]